MRRSPSRSRLGFAAACLLLSPLVAHAQTSADSAAALTGVREFWTACGHDAGRLWGMSLCGPLITVDGETGLAVATDSPPQGTFAHSGTLWIGKVPEGMQVANTAFEWNGRLWSTVRLPLPADRFTRIQLLVHESFHRIQPELHLNARDAMNAHLDERDGRYLLRLELRAMAAAIQTSGAASRRAATDALLFRAQRNRLYPGSDTLENSLEVQEGLPEYTGARLALTETGLTAARAAQAAAEFEGRPTYVRALGYGTGPLLGILLDRYAPRWRTRIAEAGFARQLGAALGFAPPPDLAAAVAASAVRYGGDSLARAEDDRAATRARTLAAYRALLVDGPVVVLRADEMYRSFNPNNLVPLRASGTVYPNGTFQGEWGVLTVERGGALVPQGNWEVRVGAPSSTDTTAAVFQGDGWRLELHAGWRLRPGPRPGDFTATQELSVRLAPTHYELSVRLDYAEESLEGAARITLRNSSDAAVRDVPLLLYRLMEVDSARVNGAPAPFTQRVVRFDDFDQLQVDHVVVALPAPLPPGDSIVLDLRYHGRLLGYAETGMLYVKDHLDPHFTILRDDAYAFPKVGYPSSTANRRAALPSYDYLVRITVPDSLVVVNGGWLVDRTAAGGTATYTYRSVKNSWRMDFTVGGYAIIQDGPLRVAYLQADSVGARRVAASARRSLDLYTAWFGPLAGEPSLTIVEIEDGYGSQADVAAILQAAAAFRDSTRDRELYHEVAHLWNPPATDRPSPRWNEGLSTFLEYLVQEEFSGHPVVVARTDRLLDWLRRTAPQRERLTRVPLADYGKEQMTDFSYSVGAVFFHLLYGVAGPERFRAIIGGYSRDCAAHGCSTRDLAAYAIRTTQAATTLFHDWVFTTDWWPLVRDGATVANLVRRYRVP